MMSCFHQLDVVQTQGSTAALYRPPHFRLRYLLLITQVKWMNVAMLMWDNAWARLCNEIQQTACVVYTFRQPNNREGEGNGGDDAENVGKATIIL